MNPRELFFQHSRISTSVSKREPEQATQNADKASRDPLNLPKPEVKASKDLLSRLQGFLLGKLTWAQVEGWSAEDLYAYATIGSQLFRAGRIQDARTVFEACEAINSKDWYFPYCLAQIQILQGENEAAIDSLQRSTRSPLERPEPHLLLAGCFLQQGDQDKAVAHLKKARAIAENIQRSLA